MITIEHAIEELERERDLIQEAIDSLRGVIHSGETNGRQYKLSEEVRARMAEGQRRRHAQARKWRRLATA